MTPSDADLPFLIVHGAIVWKVLLVVLPVIAFGVMQSRRWRKARRRQREELAALSERATTRLESGPVCLRGTIRDGTLASVVILDSTSHPRTGTPWLDCSGERVDLDGDVRVDHAASVHPGRRVLGIWHAQVRMIAADTEVIAEGTLARRASPNEAGYREAAGGWVLAAAGPPLRVSALTGMARPFPMHPARGLVFLAIAAALSFGLLRFVGKTATSALEDRSFGNHGRAVDLSNLDVYSIAAAMPGSRANALEQLAQDLKNHHYRDTATVRRLLAMNQRRHGCGGVYWWLHSAQRYEDALATAQRCKLDDGGVDALIQLGRFADALAVMPADAAPRVAGRVAIAAGRWDLAAVHADAEAEAATHPDDYDDDPQRRQRAQLRYRCLAALFRARSGDADAGARIAAAAAAPGGEACALVGAQLLPAPERAAALETAANRPVDTDDHELQILKYLATALAWADGMVAEHHFDSFYDPAMGLLDVHSVEEEWLAAWAAPALIAAGAPLRAQASALGWTAVLLVLRGDLDGARSIATRLPVMLAAEEYAAVDARAFAAVLELRGERADLPFIRMPGAEDEVELRRGEDRLDNIGFYPESCKDDYRAAIRAAQDGDGAPLGEVLQRCSTSWIWTHRQLLAVLPRITRNREALAEPLRYFIEDIAISPPFTDVAYAAFRRDLHALAGDAEEAARWQAIVAAHAPVLADRDRVVALLLWDP